MAESTKISKSERDALARDMSGFVRMLAQKVASRLPSHMDVDDLTSAGMIGLLDAIDKYDQAKSNNFRKYAEVRIKGAILDELRSQDPLGRTMRRRARELSQEQQHLEQQLGRSATHDELASHLNINLERLNLLLRQVQPKLEVSADQMSDEGRELSSWLTEQGRNDPLTHLEAKRRHEFFEQEIRELKDRHSFTLRSYYYDGLALREIAKILGVTESRCSQLLDEALEAFGRRLRIALKRHGSMDVAIHHSEPHSS